MDKVTEKKKKKKEGLEMDSQQFRALAALPGTHTAAQNCL